MSAACQVRDIFERRPDLDHSSRKLNKSFNHWNTRSWSGCTKTEDVDLGRCWEMGAELAQVILQRDGLYSAAEDDFATISGAEGNIDMMRPYGVLIGHSEVVE